MNAIISRQSQRGIRNTWWLTVLFWVQGREFWAAGGCNYVMMTMGTIESSYPDPTPAPPALGDHNPHLLLWTSAPWSQAEQNGKLKTTRKLIRSGSDGSNQTTWRMAHVCRVTSVKNVGFDLWTLWEVRGILERKIIFPLINLSDMED